MSSAEDRQPADGSRAEEKRPLWHRLPIKSGVALVILVAVGLPILSTLQPRYYERYPDLAPRMDNWRVSTHARIPCSGCHVDPGAAGVLSFAAKSIPAFYSQLIQGPSTTNLLHVPGRDACQKCHTSYRQVSSNGDLLIPHRAHVEVLDINCATCHEDLVHSENTKGYNAPEMAKCLERCHDGEQASAACVDCHTRKHVPDNHRQPNWLAIHSEKLEEIDCGECHAWSPDYCAECHSKRPKSHAGNFKKLHAPRAKKQGDRGCMTCHDQEHCKQCHD